MMLLEAFIGYVLGQLLGYMVIRICRTRGRE